jgi:hypothetical protein
MKSTRYIPALLLFLTISIAAKAQVQDNFDDDNLSSPFQWYGDTILFTIDNGVLRSNGPATAAVIYLSTPVEALNQQEWQIYTKLDFSPSGSNKLRFYLQSDSANLINATRAVYLEIGQTGADIFRLIYEEDSGKEIIWESKISYSASVEEHLKITKTYDNKWQFYLRSTSGGYIKDTSAYSRQFIFDVPYSGFVCYHTSTRRDKFYFDNFYAGPPVADITAPKVAKMDVYDEQTLELEFSEALGDDITTDNFLLNEADRPVDVTRNFNKLILTFNSLFKEENNLLKIKDIPDMSGNILIDTVLVFNFYKTSVPSPGDILINEIMADPTPPLDLPEAEYVELWNRSENHYDLSEFQINGKAIAGDNLLLKRGSYIILCRENDRDLFYDYGEVAGMNSWDILSNNGDVVLLTYGNKVIIDEINYSKSWYKSSLKSNGGFSLERRFLNFPCDQEYNWAASENSEGGTPGGKNSLPDNIQDIVPPGLLYSIAVDSVTVEIKFNEPVNRLSFKLSDITAADVEFIEYDFKNPEILTLAAAKAFEKNKPYAFYLQEINDCYGNQMGSTAYNFILPDQISKGDIIINEILFDPYPSGVDFIEIYNNSDKYLDLQHLTLSNDSARHYPVIDQPNVMPPGKYIAITTDSNRLINDYPHAVHLRQVPAMPPLPNSGGEIYLFSGKGLMDFLRYSPDSHLPFLKSTEGVSLERISPTAPADDKNNWHSAGSTSGFATPGEVNSQNFSSMASESPLSLSSLYLTPDQDGDKDFVVINYTFKNPGLIGSFSIYDPFGKKIRTLANNSTLAMGGQFIWDGSNDDKYPVKSGHYILLAEIFGISGEIYLFKEKIAVLR